MTPTKADFAAVLAAYRDGQPLSLHQGSIIVAALQRAADVPEATSATEQQAHMRRRAALWPEHENREISLLPAVLAKMTESCDLLREVRDMMRRKNPEPLRTRGHDFGMGFDTARWGSGMGQAEPGRSPPSKCPDQRAGSASPIPDPDPKESQP